MKIAITGASGHVGAALTRELIKDHHQLRLLIHNDVRALQGIDYEAIKGDMLDFDTIDSLCRDVDVVIHLAARISITRNDDDIVYKTNVEGTRNVIKSCVRNKIKRLIHFSSIHALENAPYQEKMDERRSLISNNHMAYDRSKAEGERLVRASTQQEGLSAVIMNPTAIIGPFDFKPSFLGQALMKIYMGKLPMLVKGGYNFVDVRDVADAAIKAIDKGKSGERFILSGHYLSLKDLSYVIQEFTGRKTPKAVVPAFVAQMGLPFMTLYAKLRNEDPLYTKDSLDILKTCNVFIQNEKAKKEIGYSPRSIRDTLGDSFEWYKAHGMID